MYGAPRLAGQPGGERRAGATRLRKEPLPSPHAPVQPAAFHAAASSTKLARVRDRRMPTSRPFMTVPTTWPRCSGGARSAASGTSSCGTVGCCGLGRDREDGDEATGKSGHEEGRDPSAPALAPPDFCAGGVTFTPARATSSPVAGLDRTETPCHSVQCTRCRDVIESGDACGQLAGIAGGRRWIRTCNPEARRIEVS